ncbi:MAG: EscU/YscU/HrcU family type III secretion system export apparatus switch protein [Lawsonibacter sp.]|jgi:flagellar biosynthesis protein
MSKSNVSGGPAKRAVALRYGADDKAPVIVASGMGNLAEKIVEVASEHGVPVYEDNSLATVLTQMELGREVPEDLYEAIVEIYLYFLNFDPNDPEKYRRERQKSRGEQQEEGEAHASAQ